MNLDELEKELERIQAEKAHLSELERTYKKLRDLLKHPARPSGNSSDVEAVLETVDMMEGNDAFTAEQVFNEIENMGLYNTIPKVSISAILSRLAKEGRITVSQRGVGRLPSIYSLKPNP
ncbi:MAG: hypothetical protein KF712_17305 [Akkermansiaceae bacterium]|nr:hypothetical protein [Akkermansiaceae bacterium]